VLFRSTLLPKRIALPVFASDALSSTAYAPEEIFLVLSVAGLSAYSFAPWVGLAVAAVMLIVIASYRQNVHAYPSGGGPAAEWAGLVAALQAAASAASAAVGQAPADASWADQVSGGSQGHVNTEVPSAWAALMTCVGVP